MTTYIDPPLLEALREVGGLNALGKWADAAMGAGVGILSASLVVNGIPLIIAPDGEGEDLDQLFIVSPKNLHRLKLPREWRARQMVQLTPEGVMTNGDD